MGNTYLHAYSKPIAIFQKKTINANPILVSMENVLSDVQLFLVCVIRIGQETHVMSQVSPGQFCVKFLSKFALKSSQLFMK